MQKTLFGILAAFLVFLLPNPGFAGGEFHGIIPEKISWVLVSIDEQWTQTEDIESEKKELSLYKRTSIAKDNDSTPVEERYNRQLVITLGFINLSSETYRINPSSRLEAAIFKDSKTIQACAFPTTNKTVVIPGDSMINYSFVLKMNDPDFTAAFDKRYEITDMFISPVNDRVLIEDSKGNSLLDNVQTPAVVSMKTPLLLMNISVFPKTNSSLTLKDVLLTINKTHKILFGSKKQTQTTFKIDNDEIVSVFNIPNNDYKNGFSGNGFDRLLLFMFNGEPVDNDKTAEVLSKPLGANDTFSVGIVPEYVLKKYLPDDQTKLLYYFSKCIEKLPESVAPKRYQEVNIKSIYNKINPFKVLLEYAESGDDEAIEVIYEVYDPNLRTGILFEKFPDQKSFFQWLKKLADNGSAQAQLFVGICFDDGVGVDEDIDEAIKYYKMAADQNNVEAMVNYANALYDKDKDKYLDEVVEWLRMAAERKYLRGQYWLAVTLLGTNDEENIQEGMLWLQQASFEGYPNAMYRLSLEYYIGKRIPQDNKKAFALMEKAALEKNLTKAYDMLGDFYMQGIGVKSDVKKAVICYRFGAENKIPNSMFWYGRFLCDGFNVEKDVSKGYELIKEAAQMGNTDAMKHIGLDYYYGGVAQKNDKEAFKWIEKAYIGGDWYAIALLGDFYMFGVGVKADREKAVELYKIAADKGVPFGIFRWGQYLYEQKGDDALTGLNYINTAAKMGVLSAQEYLNNLKKSNNAAVNKEDSEKNSAPNDDIDDLDEEGDVDDSQNDNNQNDAIDDLDEEGDSVEKNDSFA